jgi:hypothetical protein
MLLDWQKSRRNNRRQNSSCEQSFVTTLLQLCSTMTLVRARADGLLKGPR